MTLVDYETDGIPNYEKRWDDPCQPHVLSVGAVSFTDDGAQEVNSLYAVIKPTGFMIDDNSRAVQVNGITHSYAMQYGIPYKAALIPLEHICHNSWRIIIFNKKFEAAMSEIERYRLARQNPTLPPDRTYCLMAVMQEIMKLRGSPVPGEWKYPKFDAAYEYIFGQPPENTHHALHDARQSGWLAFELIRQGLWQLT